MEDQFMVTINLRDFYPWYTQDEFVEVPDVVAAELYADRRYRKAYPRRLRRNKAQYSLDAGDGIEAYMLEREMSPEDALLCMERHCRICRALNSLPEIQGRRVEAHYILGMSRKQIAEMEGVSLIAVHKSIGKGLEAMRKFF
jgi:RNA polymerase sigma-70 factor (ECF subfamily)